MKFADKSRKIINFSFLRGCIKIYGLMQRTKEFFSFAIVTASWSEK